MSRRRMSKRMAALAVTGLLALAGAAAAAAYSLTAKPFVFDPLKTELAQSGWLTGIGCPTNAKQSAYGAPPTYPIVAAPNYTDPACPTGDANDTHNMGLLLVKTGPTTNVASAGVVIRGFGHGPVTELGYDLRKPLTTADPRGSHCGAGAPRFNIITSDGTTYFIGCNSPPPTTQTAGNGWLRLRWGSSTGPLMAYGPSGLVDISAKQVRELSIVFDEGQDTGPDNFGLAVLDNIDVNGSLVGRGAGPRGAGESGNNQDDDNDHGGDSKHGRHETSTSSRHHDKSGKHGNKG